MKFNILTSEEEAVIAHRATEPPFSGEYDNYFAEGTYVCRRCNTPLYVSTAKFHSDCGWPSFDQEIKGAVTKKSDPDGMRVEIICSACSGHLGHVFVGERYTPKNTRHCVNSLSIKFIPKKMKTKNEIAVLGGGCFWCTEAVFSMLRGVIFVTPGYAGGSLPNPSYEDVCSGNTGHVEVARVEFDPSIIPYKDLLDIFFHIHDPTTLNQQGADVGTQYRSAIFYASQEQEKIAKILIQELDNSGEFRSKIVTDVTKLDKFYEAENYHKQYFEKNSYLPYCQVVISPKIAHLKEKYAKKLK